MARDDTGMRLSTRGLNLVGEQVIKVAFGSKRDEMYVLVDDSTIKSYLYNPISTNGFSPTSSADDFNIEVAKMDWLDGTEKIMEIAGGRSLKVRYDNGISITGIRSQGGVFIVSKSDNVARITSNKEYKVAHPIKYYRSGGGTAPLMALLEGDILAVFENGDEEDFTISLQDALDASGEGAIVGKVGLFTILSQNDSLKVKTPSGDIAIEGFGTIVREIDGTRDIKLTARILSGGNKVVDHSSEFSADHYTYIERNRVDFINGWIGVGNTGYVVDSGDFAQMRVPISGGNKVGEAPLVRTGSLNDKVDFVLVAGAMKKVANDGTLTNINTTTATGVDLVSFIYHNDMTTQIAMSTPNSRVEPFSINGYFFGYGDDHLVDVDLTTL